MCCISRRNFLQHLMDVENVENVKCRKHFTDKNRPLEAIVLLFWFHLIISGLENNSLPHSSFMSSTSQGPHFFPFCNWNAN